MNEWTNDRPTDRPNGKWCWLERWHWGSNPFVSNSRIYFRWYFSTVTLILTLTLARPCFALFHADFQFRRALPCYLLRFMHSSSLCLYAFLFIYLFSHWVPSKHIFFYQRSILRCRYEIFHKSNDIHLKRLCFVSHIWANRYKQTNITEISVNENRVTTITNELEWEWYREINVCIVNWRLYTVQWIAYNNGRI